MVRTTARFESTLAKPRVGESGAGELAALLTAGLRSKGFVPTSTEDKEFAHFFRCRSIDREYEVMVAFDFNSDRTWEVSCPPVLGRVAKLLGATEDAEHSNLVAAIASILHADARMKDIRWYRAYADRLDQSSTSYNDA
jgi:hypothetical protein